MKKFISIIIVVVFILTNMILVYGSDFKSEPMNSFVCYSAAEEVYDRFLEDVNDIEYLANNSKLVNVDNNGKIWYGGTNLGGYSSGAILHSDFTLRFSDFDRVCKLLYDFGLKGQIYDYAFIITTSVAHDCYMPVSIWINTSEGIQFATVASRRGNLLEHYQMNILSKEEYIEKFRYKPARILVNGEEKSNSYAYIRNEGAKIGFRDLMEGLGVEVLWNESENSILLMKPDGYEFEKIGLKIFIDDDNLMTITRMLDGADYTEHLRLFTSPYCEFVDDRLVVGVIQARWFIKSFVWENENNEALYAEIQVDNPQSIINISFSVKE